jgi:hypothetical protein
MIVHKLALAVLAGVSIAAAGAEGIHGKPANVPTAVVIAETYVTDLGSGYPCWCRAPEHAGERGKSAGKTQHRQPTADIIRRPLRRSSRSGKLRRKAAA